MTLAINKSEILKQAWEDAYDAVEDFGGSAIEYIASTLKLAWAYAKKMAKPLTKTDERVSDFDKFRFNGLFPTIKSNKYLKMNRVSDDENKIVVSVADVHLLETRYGYALILDQDHVVFLKDWQVNADNWYSNGIEVVLDHNYFNVKKWGDFSENFGNDEENLNFDAWLKVAKMQKNIVSWKRD